MSGTVSMQCLSCKKYLYYNEISGWYSATSGARMYIRRHCRTTNRVHYTMNGPGTCTECYVKLKREIEELKANVDFLRHSFPSSHDDTIKYHHRSSPLSSDVTLVASDDSAINLVSANKFVLASRSPVFKMMLETAMEETISGIIKISDVNYDLLHVFVNYLYTADVCLDEKIASDLLILAEKYQVKHLKEHCERYLVSSLKWDNSVSNSVFAYKHSAEKLLEASLSIITDNMDKFINTDDYRELVKKDVSLVVEIFKAHVAKQENIAAKNASPS
ncbi:hypothetical protein Dimus_035455 [Dionaea muscipula]